MKEACGEKLELLPRRMYENYLLDPEALAVILDRTETLLGKDVRAAVDEWLRGRAVDDLVQVDGARLLDELFTELTEGKEAYDKVTHGVQLTEWLLDHKPEALDEVAELLRRMLGDAREAVVEWPTQMPPK